MKYLIYLSTAVNLLNEEQIQALLAKSRIRNHSNNVTGILLYHEGTFIQLLEGPTESVDETIARISKDPSHKNITIIDEGPLKRRLFADWSMGFHKGTAKNVEVMEAYTDPQKLKTFSPGDEHPALTMLKAFVNTNLS